MPRLAQESGEVFYTVYNSHPSLVFRGDPAYMHRALCFCVNYGLTTRKQLTAPNTGNARYITGDIERFQGAIKAAMRNEIIANHSEYPEIQYTSIMMDGEDECYQDITWDDEVVNRLADEQMLEYWEKVVKHEAVMGKAPPPPDYEEYMVAQQQTWPQTEDEEYYARHG